METWPFIYQLIWAVFPMFVGTFLIGSSGFYAFNPAYKKYPIKRKILRYIASVILFFSGSAFLFVGIFLVLKGA